MGLTHGECEDLWACHPHPEPQERYRPSEQRPSPFGDGTLRERAFRQLEMGKHGKELRK